MFNEMKFDVRIVRLENLEIRLFSIMFKSQENLQGITHGQRFALKD